MPPFVFLPGTLCDERVWQYQTELFTDHFHVNLRVQNNLADMVQAVKLAPFTEFILVGFSMGGYVAQEFALKYPDRVKHLVIIGSSYLGYPPHERAVVEKALPMIEKGLFKGITQRRMKEFLHPDAYEREDLRELIQSMAGSDASTVYLRQLQATLDRPDLSERIKNLTLPLTALAGKQDQVVPPETVTNFKKLLPMSEVILVENCGHFVPLEKPDQVNEVLARIASKN